MRVPTSQIAADVLSYMQCFFRGLKSYTHLVAKEKLFPLTTNPTGSYGSKLSFGVVGFVRLIFSKFELKSRLRLEDRA